MAKITPMPKKEMERARKILTKRDFSPSTEALTGRQWIDWENGARLLGQPFDANNIPLSKLHQMRRDPMIAFGLLFSKVPLVRAPWYIESEDARVAAFVDNALRRIYSRFVFSYTNCLDFGYSAIVKRFEREMPNWKYIDDPGDGSEPKEKDVWDKKGGVEAVVWKPFVALPPDDVDPDWNEDGEFNGINLATPETARDFMSYITGSKRGREGEPDVPLDHALWATNEKDNVFGSLWGYPRIGYAYRYWWSYWFRWALADRHFEKDADPPLLVYFPHFEGVDEDGNDVDYRSLALRLGEQMRSGSTIALPSQPVMGMDEKPTNMREWEIKALENNGNFSVFNETFSYLDVAKLRAVMVPEQAFLEGSGGTSSRNVAEQLGDVFFQSQAILMAEIDDHLNRFVIPQLVAANFGPQASARKITRGFGAQDTDMMKQIIQLIGNADPTALEVDIREVMNQFGIPLLNPQQLAAIEKELEKQAMAEQPQAMQSGAGQGGTNYAGVNQYGLYEQPREVIRLADEHMWDAEPFDDEELETKSELFRDELYDLFVESYGNIAEHVQETVGVDKVEMADEPKKMTAEEILGDWLEKPETTEKKKRAIAGFITSVMDDTGKKEVARYRLNVKWEDQFAEMEKFADARAAELVKKISEQQRKEVRRFIASELRRSKSPAEIAQAVRAKFSEWPGWKADRLARTEAMLAYNNGALNAYQAGGVTHVKASDAAIYRRTGDKTRSDPSCITRDGRIFTIDEAFAELQKEHPNGTLSFSPVVPKVSLSFVVGDVPSPEPALAYFSEEDRTVYFDPSLADKTRGEFLYALADHLEVDDSEVVSQWSNFLTAKP